MMLLLFCILDNTVIDIWNVRTLSATAKLYELIYELNIYQWMIIGISEMRWKGDGERSSDYVPIMYCFHIP